MRIPNRTPHRRAFAALLSTAALVAMPAYAQVATTTPPPPAVEAIAPPVSAQAAPAAAPAVQFSAPAPVVQALPQAAAQPAVTPPPVVPTVDAASVPKPVVRHIVRRSLRAERTTTVAPTPAPEKPADVAPPVAATPAPAPQAAVPVTAQPAPQVADQSTITTTQTRTAAPVWPWLLAGLLILGGIVALIAMRRRRADEVYDEADYVAEPVAIVPVAAAPLREPAMIDPFVEVPVADVVDHGVTPTEAAMSPAEHEDLAGLADMAAPVADRPWLEFSMRPISARTDADEALVEIELIVGNAGSVAATDVEISTFMFASGTVDDAGMERFLIEHEAVNKRITIAPGEGARIDATLAVPRGSLDESFRPIIAADARYRLPDGSEGRTHASFDVGLIDGAGIAPIPADRKGVHDDVTAVLHGEPEHA